MSDHWRVLLTGPTNGIDAWLEAAQAAGWEAEAWPLQEAATVDRADWPEALPDWIAVTSSNALPALTAARARDARLAEVPLAVVGDSTAERLYQDGWTPRLVPQPGAADARGLARLMVAELAPGQRVLWPRGPKAQELGTLLETKGVLVEAPVVYQTRPVPHDGPPPAADVVFFAAPSAVELWCAAAPDWIPAAVGIGWTTFEALQENEARFSTCLPLASPDPVSLRVALEAFAAQE